MHSAENTKNKKAKTVSIKEYKPKHEEIWDNFVRKSSKNGTLLHTRRFLLHNIANTTKDASLLFFSNATLIAVMPAVVDSENGRLVFNSHKNSTYGGLVVGIHTSFQSVEKCIELLISYAGSRGINEIIIRQSPKVYHTHLSDEIDYALWKRGFQIKFRECELAMDLHSEFRVLYNNSTKRNVAKALRAGVVVMECDQFMQFWQILATNLMEKHGVKPVHSQDEIQILAGMAGAENIKLFGAYLGQRMIGGVLLFVGNDKVVHAQYIASDHNFQKFRPVNALIDHIAGWAKGRGFGYFNLGMANEPGGATINEGLFRFKEGFGARGTSRETLHMLLTPEIEQAR